MPGPISDSYDPEWGTQHNAGMIANELQCVYDAVSDVLGKRPPMCILDLVGANLSSTITATLTEKQWRIIRFALERAGESL